MTAADTIKDHLDELGSILASIEEKHGTVQAASDHRYVRELHRQARFQIDQIRQVVEEQKS